MAVIREQRQFKIGTIGVARASRGGEITGEAIANAASQWQDYFYQRAREDAVKAGTEAGQAAPEETLTTMNPQTGKPEAYKHPKNFGRFAAEAYERVIDARYEDSMQEEIRLKAKELANKYEYSPNGYKTAMSDYISEMSKNATGKYKEYIANTGSRYIADTFLNLQDRANARARAALANSITDGINKSSDSAYISAKSGNFLKKEGEQVSEADMIANKAITDAKNGATSNVLASNADAITTAKMQESVATGAVEYILSGTVSKLERDTTILAIRRGDPAFGNLPKKLQGQIKQALEYITPSNIDTIINHASGVSADYNAVEAGLIQQRKDEIDRIKNAQEQALLEMEMGFPETVGNFGDLSSNLSYYGFNNRDETGQLMPQAISGTVASIESSYNDRVGVLRKQRINTPDQYSRSELENDIRDTRQAALRPLLLQAAAEGNVDTLKLVLNAEGGDISKLTDSQREFVGAILSSDLYNALEDNSFLNDTLSKTKDHYAEQLAKMQVNFDLTNDITAAEKLLSNGMFNETQFDALINNIKKSVRPDGITQEQANSLESRLRQASGIGIVTQFSAGASSQELLDLKAFVDSKGQVRDGMTQATIKAGQEILKNVSSDKDISAVTSKLSGLKADVAEREKEKEAARIKLELQSTVVSGFGNSNDERHRDIAQEMIDKAGLKISEFSTYDPQTQLEMIRLSTSAVPTGLVTELKKLASGQPIQGAESVMAMFMQINRTKGTPFGDSINSTTIAMLEDANSIVATLGGNFNDVVTKLREMRSDEKSNKYVQAELGEEKGKQKTLEQVLLARYENDTLLAVEMKPVLEYYLRTQKTLDDALSRIDTIVDQRYAESEFIVDPRLPAGNKFRSRYALEAVFKDPNDRKEFIRTVESQLPSGYSLFHNQTQKAGGAAAGVAMLESAGQPVPEELRQEAITQQRTKQVYLMPVEGTAYPEYYAYYVDENNELRPLIFERSVSEKQNELVWPMFSPEDIATYVKINQLNRENELKAKAQEDQAWQDQLNKSTWEGYYGGIQKQAESVVK